MNHLLYLDNSALTIVRGNVGAAPCSRQVEFLKRILNTHGVSISSIILTDKLFLEAIWQGKIRKELLKDKKSAIQAQKQIIHQKILNRQLLSPEEIEAYIRFIENFFQDIIERMPLIVDEGGSDSSILEKFFQSKV